LRAGRTVRQAVLVQTNVAGGIRDHRGGTATAAEIMLRELHHRHDGDRPYNAIAQLIQRRLYDLLLSALSLSADD